MSDPGIIPFSDRQIPDSIVRVGRLVGAPAWRFNQGFVEAVDGSRRFFTLAAPYVAGKILVFKDGIKQKSPSEVIFHPPTIVEFVVAPTASPASYLDTYYLVEQSGEATQWVLDEALTGTKNGSNAIFTTLYPYSVGKIALYKNGRKLVAGQLLDFIEIDDRTIQIVDPLVIPASDDYLEATYMRQGS